MSLVASWNCLAIYKNKYAGLFILYLLVLLNPCLLVEMFPGEVFSIGITLVDFLQNWTNWFHLLFLREGLLGYSGRLHDFSRCCKKVYVNSFFPRTVRLWNSLAIECFPLTNDLNGRKSRANRHLIDCGFFPRRFPLSFSLFVLLFLATPFLLVALPSCME